MYKDGNKEHTFSVEYNINEIKILKVECWSFFNSEVQTK